MAILNNKVLHIATDQKFLIPFIDIISKYYNINDHKFFLINKKNERIPHDYIIFINKRSQIFKILFELNKNKKIILHGLFSNELLTVLFFQPWVLKRCYWAMHGGDFYFPEKQSWVKKKIIKNIRNFITYLKGDFNYVKNLYGAKGKYHECFMYPSNLYKEHSLDSKDDSTVNIQIGNSADPSNNQIEILEKIKKYKNMNIKIFAPLSYGGEQSYVDTVILKGKEIFGDRFIPLLNFMKSEEYLDFLGNIDIAIFAHRRQQAMGNIITLLGLGKKIYIRASITSWQFFKDIDVRLFDYNQLNLDSMDKITKKANSDKIKSYFSEENYLKQLQSFLN